MIERIAKEMLRTGVRFDSVRKICVASIFCTDEFARLLTSVFKLSSFKNFYGASEVCGAICAGPNNTISYDSLGYPAPLSEMKVIIW